MNILKYAHYDLITMSVSSVTCYSQTRHWTKDVTLFCVVFYHPFSEGCLLLPRVVPSWTSLCHLHLSSVSLSGFSNEFLANFSMSSIHHIFGLPCYLAFLLLEQCPA